MILQIYAYGQPVLKRVADDITPEYPELQKLIDDMWETMYDSPGVGLAAPQLGILLRVVVIDAHDPAYEPLALVNPEIVKRSGERLLDEGCLSVPGFRGQITRSVKVLAKGIDPATGKEVRIRAEDDLMAEALEHEIDHVNGILYIDSLPSPDALVPVDDAPEIGG